MPPKKTYRFSALIEPIDIGLVQHCIVVPPEVMDEINIKGRIRVKGKMKEVTFELAIQSKKNGVRYFSVSRDLKKKINADVGEKIPVQFQLADPEELNIPEELSALLEQDEEALSIWNTFTTGAKRGLIHYINTAKSTETRINRCIKIMNKAKAGQLYYQQKS